MGRRDVFGVLVTDDVNRSVDHLRADISRGVSRRERRSGVLLLGAQRQAGKTGGKKRRRRSNDAGVFPAHMQGPPRSGSARTLPVTASSPGQPQAKIWQSKSLS